MSQRGPRKSHEHTIETARRDAHCAELRAQGLSYRKIAERFDLAVSTVYEAVQRAIAAVPIEAVNELRAIECQRLDAIIAKAWDIVAADHPFISFGKVIMVADEVVQDAAPVISALNLIRTTSESKRRLLGLDAPSRQTITVITEDAVDAELRAIESEMRAIDAAKAQTAKDDASAT